jgi:drug/metabolite transporter (DMT)-like permease
MLYLGLVPTALAYLIRFRQMTRFHYTFVSFAGYLVPVFAAFWGVVLLDESVTPQAIGALLVILLGIALA